MKKTALLLFLATCLLQWFVSAKMIWEQEQLYATGTSFKLKTIPIDPNDPFRGKYITLRYAIGTYSHTALQEEEVNNLNEKVYVELQPDEEGFGEVVQVSNDRPTSTTTYCTAHLRSFNKRNGAFQLELDYPFQTYFMEETKAQKAEDLYREVLRDSGKQVYGIVNVQDGNATLVDVQVDGVSIKDLVVE